MTNATHSKYNGLFISTDFFKPYPYMRDINGLALYLKIQCFTSQLPWQRRICLKTSLVVVRMHSNTAFKMANMSLIQYGLPPDFSQVNLGPTGLSFAFKNSHGSLLTNL